MRIAYRHQQENTDSGDRRAAGGGQNPKPATHANDENGWRERENIAPRELVQCSGVS